MAIKKIILLSVLLAAGLAILSFLFQRVLNFNFKPYAIGILICGLSFLIYKYKLK